MNILLDELEKIEKWINDNPVIIKKNNSDGRTDSLLNEIDVAKRIANQFSNVKIKSGNRSFGDIYINIDDVNYPVNIKLTSETNNSNDNLVGMVSIMSHVFFNGKKTNGHVSLAKKMVEGKFSDNETDYGYISITKETGLSQVSTMITMEDYTVNPSNGFQANFNKIKTMKDKTIKAGRDYMYKKYFEYCKKKAEPYLILLEGLTKKE